jgi:hypothetical protein
VLLRCVPKELGVVGRERGTPEPKATVGVVERGVGGARRRSMLAVGVRRPDDETDDRGVLARPDKLPVEPVDRKGHCQKLCFDFQHAT